jgi:hypothetical protein
MSKERIKQQMKYRLIKAIEILLLSAALLSPLIARAAVIEADFVGFALKLQGAEVFAELQKDWPKQTGAIYSMPAVSLSQDLHERVRTGEMPGNDALQIEAELMSRQGTTYYLPSSQEELKLSVGFPKETDLSREDLRDLLPVHVQNSINVSPLCAAYLISRLGVSTHAELPVGTTVGAISRTELSSEGSRESTPNGVPTPSTVPSVLPANAPSSFPFSPAGSTPTAVPSAAVTELHTQS